MPSAGNDIVSLDLINKERSCDSRFYRKIITGPEENMYNRFLHPHLPFENFVWFCWSVKESAYKFIKRSEPGYLFAPVKISMGSINVSSEMNRPVFTGMGREIDADREMDYSGTVTAAGQTLHFRSKVFQHAIASVVNETGSFEHIRWGIHAIEGSTSTEQSKEVRSFALQQLQQLFPGKTMNIPDSCGSYPVLMDGPKEMAYPLSFAHHGNMVSYSLNLLS